MNTVTVIGPSSLLVFIRKIGLALALLGIGLAGASAAAPAGALQKWLQDYRAALAQTTNASAAPNLLQTGEQLARQRRVWLRQLIREHPEQALAEALRYDEYQALPGSIRSQVERPFSSWAEYLYLPTCANPNHPSARTGPDHRVLISLPDGTEAEAFTYGRRAAVMSKHRLPVSGILLDGVAALHDRVFREVRSEERAVVASRFSPGHADLSRSFASGKSITGSRVLALAGDRLFAFADAQELQRLDQQLSALDARPGPNAGSSVLLADAAQPAVGGGIDFAAVEKRAADQASAWTETKKKVLLIRLDFSDAPGAPVSQLAASTEMNGPSSDFIRAMSYGKTWIEATVSSNVYRMPQSALYYSGTNDPSYDSGSFSSLNSELLRDARNLFRTTKSGADAAIDIGPVDDTGTGGSGGLGDYDIVAVFFAGIGMKSGGIWYAGLAGGADLWVQDANYTSLYTHEFGHNYGIGHASFWQTTDGSVIGDGYSEEYGDIFDVMGSGPAGRGHYHSQAKALLGWLGTNDWADASFSGSGNYRIYRIDDANTVGAPRGVRVTRSAVPGSEEYYWLSYRPSYVEDPHLVRGAYLNWQRPYENRCWLLDTTPGSVAGKNDAPLDLGKTYAEPAINLYLTPLAVGGSGSEQYLDVRINLGPYPGNHAPSVSAISGPLTVSARTPVTFSVSANDLDNDPLAYFWDAQDGSVNANSSTLTHAWTVGGSASIAVTVSDMKGGTTSVTNQVTITDPLDSWSQSSVGTTGDLQDVVWGKGRFVAADYWGTSYASWDGVSWENEGTLPDFESQPRLAFGAGTFVVVGKQSGADAAQICYSLDGRLWHAASFPAGVPQARAVAYGGGQFIALGSAGTVLRSTNGVTWSVTTVAGLPDFDFVTWDGTAWVAVANNDSGYAERIWTSLDGIVWTQGPLAGMQVFGIYSAAHTVYAVGWYGGLKYSTDHGLTWQNAFLPGTGSWSTYHFAAAEDGTLLLAAQAMDETGSPYALLVSTDGRTWARSSGNLDVASSSHALAFGFGRFLSVGDGGTVRQSGSFYPNNHAPQANWVTAPTNASARVPVYYAGTASDLDGDTLTYTWDFGGQTAILDGPEIAPLFALGGNYVTTLRVSDGRGGLTTLSQPLTIADPARTWTERNSGVTVDLAAIAANTTNVVIVGNNAHILTSADGITWTPSTTPEWGGNLYFHDLTWDGSQYLAVGDDYDFDINSWVGVIYSSPEGTNWTRRFKGGSGTVLNAVAANTSTRVAVGEHGTVLASPDGWNWSAVTIPGLDIANMTGATFGGGVFLFLGFTNSNGGAQVFTSVDGTNWIDRAAGTTLAGWQDMRKGAWLGDRFVASGWFSKLRVSTDGGQSFVSNRPHTEETPALAYGDGIWYAAGVDRDVSNAQVDIMSLDGVNWLSFAAPLDTNRMGAVFFQHHFIVVGAGGHIWQSCDLSATGGFAEWQLAHFPNGGLAALANHDPDGDGVANALEYAFGRDPNAASGINGAAQLPHFVKNTNSVWLHLDLPEPAPEDVIYTIRGTTNLTGIWGNVAQKNGTNAWQWLGGGASHLNFAPVSGGRAPLDIGVPDNISSSPRYYLRLQVQTP